MRVAVLMQVCDSDREIAPAALSSLVSALRASSEAGSPQVQVELFIVDDASQTDAGGHLASAAEAIGVAVTLKRWPAPIGFRGSVTRMMAAFAMAAAAERAGGGRFDFVIKIDPDTLLVRPGLGDFLATRCVSGRGIWGVTMPARGRDRLLYLLDLLPIGFRRKQVGNDVRREWSLSRLRPVWWSDVGRRALLRRGGYRFRFTAGCFYAVGGDSFRDLAAAGIFSRVVFGRHGFVASEEDPLISTLVASLGDPIVDLNAVESSWGHPSVTEETDATQLIEAGTYVVHPLKGNDTGRRMRQRFIDASGRRWGEHSPVSAINRSSWGDRAR